MGEGRRENTDQTGFKRRFTVPEAAHVLGISPEAVRTRLSRGTLESVRDSGRVFVLLDHDITSHNQDISGDQTVLVESLRDQVAFLQRELERRADEAGELRRIIAALTQRIPEIEAPRETSPESLGGSQTVHEGGPEWRSEERETDLSANQARREGSVTNLLPTPTDSLPFWVYAVTVVVSAGLYFLGTFPEAPAPLLTYAPILFGFWLGIKRRGRPYGIYLLASVLVGILMSGAVIAELVTVGEFPSALKRNLPPNFIFWFVTPAFLFLSGSLLGDALKRAAWPAPFAEPTMEQGTRGAVAGLSVRATVVLAVVLAFGPAFIEGIAQIVATLLDGNP